MRLGRAYKMGASAAGHKARALALFDAGDHTGATKEEIAFINCIEDIPSRLRQKIMPFVDACIEARLAVIRGHGN